MEAAGPTAARGETQDRGREARRQDLADLLDAGLEELDDRDRLAGLCAVTRAMRSGAILACATRITSS
jgi:hypothetical protein